MQFDNPDSGFSFQSDGELDMRFDPSNLRTAHMVVNEYSESDLADILYRFGEEPKSKSIAHAIVQARPINGTVQLASVISSVYSSRGKIHPATLRSIARAGYFFVNLGNVSNLRQFVFCHTLAGPFKIECLF